MIKTIEKVIIGSRIKETRIKQKLSQRDLCRRTGIKQMSLYAYENGFMEPSLKEIVMIVTALNVTSDYITGRID